MKIKRNFGDMSALDVSPGGGGSQSSNTGCVGHGDRSKVQSSLAEQLGSVGEDSAQARGRMWASGRGGGGSGWFIVQPFMLF